MYFKASIVYLIRQDIKFTCVSYDSICLEISAGMNNKNSKNVLVGLIYRHLEILIPEFSKKTCQNFC